MEKYKPLIKFYIFWGSLISVVDILLSVDRGVNYKCCISYSILLLLLVVIHLRLKWFDVSWNKLGLDLLISTIAIISIYILTVINELKMLEANIYVFFVIWIPIVAMIILGIYTYYDTKKKKNSEKVQTKTNSSVGIKTTIITPTVASFYIVYRNIIKNKSDNILGIYWIVMSLIATGFVIWIGTIYLLQIYENIKLERINDK